MRSLFVGAMLISGVALADERDECIAASESAQQLRAEHKLVQSRERFLACARDVCPAIVRKDCVEQVADMEKRVPSLVLRATDESGHDLIAVKVFADGKLVSETLDGKAIWLDPGVHELRFETSGSEPVVQKVVVADGEQNRAVTIAFAPPPKPAVFLPPPLVKPRSKGLLIAGLATGGLGLVGLGFAAGFGAVGLGDLSTMRNTCAPSCSMQQIDATRTTLNVADALWIVSGSLVAIGTILVIVHMATGSSPSTAFVTPRGLAF